MLELIIFYINVYLGFLLSHSSTSLPHKHFSSLKLVLAHPLEGGGRQLKFLGHILRKNCLEKDVLFGRIKGEVSQGQVRNEILKVIDGEYSERYSICRNGRDGERLKRLAVHGRTRGSRNYTSIR